MTHNRFGFARIARFFALAGAAAATATAPSPAHAQQAGLTNKPIPNVLLLVDTSGSMERMIDGSLPVDNPASACNPGVATNPNRWGLLLQALTGTFQPYYSCQAMSRAAGSQFAKEYSIATRTPYDTDYILPHHRPLTGNSAANACANVPYKLPGSAASGVGGGGYMDATVDPKAFIPDAIQSFYNQYLVTTNGGALGAVPSANNCTFDQANDGQLDAVKDFVRFGLMTFDNDTRPGIGVTAGPFPTGGSILTAAGPPAQPFDGQWSYLRSPGNPAGSGAASGFPPACAAIPFEAGARHWAAPPWEGRMVPFANPVGSLLDIQNSNAELQQVLLTSRPYGATPIDGLMDDARDYLWYNDYGPWGTQAGYADPFVKATASCRDQFIILLTDGAPNLDMRPDCQGTGGQCPYQDSWRIADELYRNAPGNRSKVATFVIGFSVNGSNTTPNDGFPASYAAPAQRSCKAWFADTGADGGNKDPKMMETRCAALNPPAGSTAEACCELNKIALYGSGGPTATAPLGAFFADSAADLVVAFSRILAQVSKVATTRTTPASSPTANVSGKQENATYVASFIPNARKVWSGEIDRTRNRCTGSIPASVPQSELEGDSYAVNTAVQAEAEKRWFFTAVGDSTGTVSGIATVDSQRTMRPYSAAAPADGVPVYRGLEVAGINNSLFSTTNFTGALGINDNTCKKTQYVAPGGTTFNVPSLTASDCTEVIWDFATAYSKSVNKSGFNFNLRCNPTTAGTTSLATAGLCSISGATCSIANPGATCTVPGETCVPECAALGAVFRSAPLVVGPPSGFLRDEGFRSFQSLRAGRRPVMYVATTDGVLHAFKAMPDSDSTLAPSNNYELWGFVPPAVLPRLATNYPGGQQVLLDGTAVVREVVWDRTATSTGDASLNKNDWHTTLVASLGSGGGGYYALNVSDADCGGRTNADACRTSNAWEQPSPGAGATNLASVAIGADTVNGSKKGPHFLWQLTDVERDSSGTDQARDTRANVPGDNKTFVALFGKQTFTPAIATVQVVSGATGPRQIGVAILPGGLDGPPVPGATCARAVSGAYGGFSSATDDASDATNLPARGSVRRWGKTNCSSPVAGRGLTLVRLDNGEILRHFGRKNMDVPTRIKSVTTDSPFDSPVTGTPVVYPSGLGQTAQRVFVGDADGTLWRLDLSATCDLTNMNACPWKVTLFADTVAKSPVLAGAAESMPIVVPPVISQSPAGSLVVNVATGDQENIVPSTDRNYVMSIEEQRFGTRLATLRWFHTLANSERVTGPMAVFDRTLYLATFTPQNAVGTDVCGSTAKSYLWGLDYYNPVTAGTPSSGGQPRWCPGAVSSTGNCSVALATKEDVTTSIMGGTAQIIPGVSVRASLSCIDGGALTDDFGTGITSMTPSRFEISFNWSAPRSGGALPSAQSATMSKQAPTPRYNASLDAWAFVTD